jgi:hypothetical protein
MAPLSALETDGPDAFACGECLPAEPVLHRKATLVDLLDRVLDRGVIVHADVVITLAGVPLIGASLRLALASMETMTHYGLLTEWDSRIRLKAQEGAAMPSLVPAGSRAPAQALTERGPCAAGPEPWAAAADDVLLDEVAWYRVPASHGLGPTWRRGRLLLTADRLGWVYAFDDRVLFEARLSDVTRAAVDVQDLDGLVGRRPVLVVSHRAAGCPDTALFCTGPSDAEALGAWAEAIRSALPEVQRMSAPVLVPAG